MQGNVMQQMGSIHKPTLLGAGVVIVAAFLIYHFTIGKGRR